MTPEVVAFVAEADEGDAVSAGVDVTSGGPGLSGVAGASDVPEEPHAAANRIVQMLMIRSVGFIGLPSFRVPDPGLGVAPPWDTAAATKRTNLD